MHINILTLFPPMFESPFGYSIVKRAKERESVSIHVVNIRDFSSDAYQTVDDHPYGGGPGMVMMVEPIHKALQSIGAQKGTPGQKILLMSAKGTQYTQQRAREFSALESLTIICGHYEGVDERVALHLIDEEIRIGEYVLTGGELPAMVITDSIVRLLPGVLGDDKSALEESHKEPGYLEHPQYTRPASYQGWNVPDVLIGGNHAAIEEWKQQKSSNL